MSPQTLAYGPSPGGSRETSGILPSTDLRLVLSTIQNGLKMSGRVHPGGGGRGGVLPQTQPETHDTPARGPASAARGGATCEPQGGQLGDTARAEQKPSLHPSSACPWAPTRQAGHADPSRPPCIGGHSRLKTKGGAKPALSSQPRSLTGTVSGKRRRAQAGKSQESRSASGKRLPLLRAKLCSQQKGKDCLLPSRATGLGRQP